MYATPQDLPFKMEEVRLPAIPSGEVTLTDFGAVGDGSSLCTEAFAKAFNALENMGGGVLTEDPCVNSAESGFKLVNEELRKADVGDPRWNPSSPNYRRKK